MSAYAQMYICTFPPIKLIHKRMCQSLQGTLMCIMPKKDVVFVVCFDYIMLNTINGISETVVKEKVHWEQILTLKDKRFQ